MAKQTDDINKLQELEFLLAKKFELEASQTFEHFVRYIMPEYKLKWFHKVICKYINMLANGDIKKLMIFVPPQHGKSQLSSRFLPAFLLGKDPDTKIAVTSYAKTLTDGFNNDCQLIIDDMRYRTLFPDTRLETIGVKGKAKRTSDLFEIVDHKGYYKAVGVGGGLTGFTVDMGIIDDPFKDRQEANSEVTREKVWLWYNDVFKTRLHNDSKQLLLFTRWHQDDLAGRILDPKNEHYDEEEASEWTVLALPALKEKYDNEWNTAKLDDPREIDQALWEEKHSAAKYIKRRRIVPSSFASLDQQRPSILAGNKIKKDWFTIMPENQLPFNPENQVTNFYIDGAYTEKTQNDATGLLACTFFRGKLYIYNCIGIRKELYEFLNYFPIYTRANYAKPQSKVSIELKASGYSMMSMLNTPRYGNYNAVGLPSKVVAVGKFNRVENAEPFLASGKIVLVQGGWNREFIEECIGFPNLPHDDMVDVLCYAIDEWFIQGVTQKKGGVNLEELGLY